MRISMQEAETTGDLDVDRKWGLGLSGPAVDDRGKAANEFLFRHTERMIKVSYDSKDFQVDIDGTRVDAESLSQEFVSASATSVILEATTLGFAELLLCCRALKALGLSKISFLYVEPARYRLWRQARLLHKRDFELSEQVSGYRAIPGSVLMLGDRLKQRVVFFLGYEEARLDRAMEDYQMIQPSSCSVVFGVPAFKPGWEMDAFANNVRVIKERNISGGVYFCGAENPAAAYNVIARIRSEISPTERLFLGPIGTKPAGIAVALFCSVNSRIGVLYDHPKRQKKRSENIGRWHLYEAHLTE